MKRKIAFLALQLAAVTFAGEPRPHEYSFRYPMTVEKPCLEAAKDISEALARATGVAVQRYDCARDYDYFKITIQYLSAERLYVVPERDRYPTYDACAADLARRKQRYASFTKLTAFQAFCAVPLRYPSPFGYPDHSADLFIDGFGEPERRPQRLEVELTGRPVEGERIVVRALFDRLEALGVPVTRVGFLGYRPSEGTLGLSYYGDRRLSAFSNHYATLQACREGGEELRLFSGAPPLVGVFCAETVESSVWSHFQLHALWDIDKISGFHHEWLDGKYGDFASCQADRSRVIALYKTTLGKHAVGALCSTSRFSSTAAMSIFIRTDID